MYEAEADPYCYPGTAVLINKLDLKDQAKLSAFEAEITAQRAAEPLPAGDLDYAQYRAIHRHLFQDVYAWAGEARTVRIFKEGSAFCYPEHIDREMRQLFTDLSNKKHFKGLDAATFANEAAHFLAQANAIHPFREGNGRTQLSFLALLAEEAGHPLHLERLDAKAMLEATVASFSGGEAKLATVISELIR